ncbi:hypothetical protein [Agathobacter sp.]
MKKNTIIMFIILTCMFIMSACQKVPDEVKKNMEQYGKNGYQNDRDNTYCSVDELKNISMADMEVHDKNIIFPSKVDFSNLEEVGEMTFKFQQNYTEYMSYYCEQFGIDSSLKTISEGALEGDSGEVVDDNKVKKYLYISESGVISYMASNFYDEENISNSMVDTEKIYLSRGDGTDKKIKFRSGEADISEEVEFAETMSKKIIKGVDGFSTEVRTIHLLENNENEQYAIMNLQLKYKGMILDFFGGGIESTEDGLGKVSNMDNYINIGLSDKNEISRLSANGILRVEKYNRKDKVIDLQTAINIFENEMASFNKVDVCEIEPVYMLVPIYDVAGGEYYAKGGNEVKAIPVYSFLIKYGNDDSEIGIQEGNELVYFNVNMLTGEVYTNFESKGYAISEETSNDSKD